MHRLGRLVLALFITACGGDDDESKVESPGNFGTCDLRAVRSSCIESTGPSASIQDQMEGCADAGGTWTTGTCPDEALVGCCSYTFGLEFRECFYEGTASMDPEAYCATWEDGVWVPGG